MPYFTGLGTAALAVLTTFGRLLIAAADAGAARTTLGIAGLSDTALEQLSPIRRWKWWKFQLGETYPENRLTPASNG